jgi:ABC-2 type transport system permease protein
LRSKNSEYKFYVGFQKKQKTMNKFLLGIVSLFKGLYEKAGVDFQQLKIILALKLTMDNRRQNASSMRGMGSKKDEPSNRFLVSLLFLGLFSLFMTTFIFISPTPYIGFTFYFAFVMMLIIMTLISDYSSVLLDTADNVILLPRPVNSKTLFWSRLTHISLFVGQIVFALLLIPSIAIAVKFGLEATCVFIIMMILIALFSLFLTTVLYLVIIKYASEEKLKDAINYMQIGMAIFFYAGYQILPRLIGVLDIKNSELSPAWWHTFIPPMWMSGAMDAVITGNLDGIKIGLTLLAILAPLVGIWYMSRYFSSGFSDKLTPLSTEYSANIGVNTPSVSEPKKGFVQQLSSYVTSNSVESGVFQLIWWQLSRDRKLKLRLYPQLAYSFVIFIMLLMPYFRKQDSFWDIIGIMQNSRTYIMLIYMSSLTVLTMMINIVFSDDYKAAWVYYAVPIKRPGDILAGSFKAQMLRYFVPFFIVYALIILLIWGFSVIDDVVFGFFNIMIFTLAFSLFTTPKLPFSEMPTGNSQGGNTAFGFLTMFAFLIIGGVHYLISKVPYVVTLTIPLQLIILYYLLRSYRNIGWKNIDYGEIQ